MGGFGDRLKSNIKGSAMLGASMFGGPVASAAIGAGLGALGGDFGSMLKGGISGAMAGMGGGEAAGASSPFSDPWKLASMGVDAINARRQMSPMQPMDFGGAGEQPSLLDVLQSRRRY